MNDQSTPVEAKLTLVPTREPSPGNKYVDHKRLENVADAILRLSHSEFKLMCLDLHSISKATGKEPREVEDCIFDYANRVIEEGKQS
jgi:hypothetical protein